MIAAKENQSSLSIVFGEKINSVATIDISAKLSLFSNKVFLFLY
jgi:hypothetical protein